MSNRETDAAWRYHDATKHSSLSVRASAHRLDWANQPRPFKLYRGLDPIALPTDLPAPGVAALRAIVGSSVGGAEAVPDLRTLAYVLFCSAGVTKRKAYPGGEMALRAASCTGALYEIELYVVCQDLPGLDAGIYHFGPADFALRRLRRGDYRGVLLRASGGEPATAGAPAIVVCTGTYWRNAWKYGARTYRHFGWDNGTILANLLAAAAAVDLRARVVGGFVDRTVNELLALDADREVAFSMVPLGRVGAPPPEPPPLEPLAFDTEPLSRSEVDYPIMRDTHAASSLASPHEVAAWRDAARTIGAARSPSAPDRLIPLRPAGAAEIPGDWLEDVIRRRGSTRRFRRGASWTFEQLSTALVRATSGIEADFVGDATQSGPLLNDLYLIVHAVDGLAPGAYVLDRGDWSLERLREGEFRDEAGYLGLEQDLPADASFVVFFLADLRRILDRLGNRGYRAAQLEAGILGGRLYLAAYAQRLGASGLTFYDDDVVEFFSPHAEGKSAIFCMTQGRSH